MVSSGKILLTTSRNPTPRIRTFCADLSHALLDVVRVNRGKMSMDEVAEKALEHQADRVVISDRRHGGPGTLKFFRVDESGLVSIPPLIHIAGIRLRREFSVSSVKPALSLVLTASQTSSEVLRVEEALSRFFSIPIVPMDEAVKTGSTQMCLLRDKSGRITITFTVEPRYIEVGPQIIVSSVEW